MATGRAQIEIYAAQRDVLGEGPIWSATEQSLFWLDIASRTLFRKGLAEMDSQSWSLPDFPGCLAEMVPGRIAIAMGDGLQEFDFRSEAFTLLRGAPSRSLGTRFNDGKVDPLGRLWVGTMQNNFRLNEASVPIDRSDGVLYRFDAEGGVCIIERSIGVPNSFAWSPDGKLFYFADSLRGQIYVYDFDADTGTVCNKRVFFESPDHGIPDGSTIDVDGCLWNARWAAGAVLRITPEGKIDCVIEVPVPLPTSCIFGGPNFDVLYVTSARQGLSPTALDQSPLSGSVFAIHGLAQGMEVPALAAYSDASWGGRHPQEG